MSTTIDQKVVEMRFDNQQFERNVSTTMSTLDKLKAKLNFNGASKGLENISTSAKNVDMSSLGKGVEAVGAKFSALEVMGVTALANLTNSAVNYGKRMVKALTIDPVSTGFSEYELKMGSVQTILASTGEDLETVNKYLEELNRYSDMTIYSFSDMTQNIGKFTNAGVKLEDAVMAIKGISNEAAVSGANANEASRAMYNFAQALSSGFVKLVDWKSIELANMATVEFKQHLLDAAVEMGTLTKRADGMYDVVNVVSKANANVLNATHNFNDSLGNQWMTTEVLIETLREYADETTEIGKKASAAAQEVKTFTQLFDTLKESAQSGWARTWEIVVGDFYEAKDVFTKLSKVVGGFIDKMSDARNDVLEGALTSKWEQLTDKIEAAGFSVEDFEKQLKNSLTKNGKSVGALTKKYGSLAKAVQAGKVPIEIITDAIKRLLGVEDDLNESTEKVTKSVEDFNEIVNKVMRGEFGNGAERIRKLTEAGYDYATIQNKVNELLGSSVRHTSELTEAQAESVNTLAKLTDEQLKNKGYTEEQIEALRELEKVADGTDSTISDLIKTLEKPSGRTLLLESFSHMWKEIQKIFDEISNAWTNIFGESDSETKADGLYTLIERFHELTTSITVTEETARTFRTIMEGIFAGLSITSSVASMSIWGGLKILNSILGVFGTNIAKVAEHIANYIIKFNEWVETETMFGSSTKWSDISAIVTAITEGLRDCVKAFLELERVQVIINRFKDLFSNIFGEFGDPITFFKPENLVQTITDFFDRIEAWITGIDFAEDVSTYIVEGLSDGLKYGLQKINAILMKTLSTVFLTISDLFGANDKFRQVGNDIILGIHEGMSGAIQKLVDVATKVFTIIYETITGLFQIHSPSKVMMAVGGFIIAGLIAGLTTNTGEVGQVIEEITAGFWEGFKNLAKSCVDIIKYFDFGKLVAVGLSVGLFKTLKNLTDVLAMFGNPFEQFGKLMGGLGSMFKSIGEGYEALLKSEAFKNGGKAILSIALAIGVLVAAVVVLAKLDATTQDIWKAVGVVTAISVLVGVLAVAIIRFQNSAQSFSAEIDKSKGFGKLSASISTAAFTILAIGIAVALMAVAFKNIAEVPQENITKATKVFGAMVVGIIVILSVLDEIYTHGKDVNFKGVGKIFTKLAWAMILMVGAIKLASKLKAEEILEGSVVMGLVLLFFRSIIKVTNGVDDKSINQVGKLAARLSIALLLMIGVIKIASMLSWGEVAKGGIIVVAIGALFRVFIESLRYLKNNQDAINAAGKMILRMSIAMLIMAAAVKIIGGMEVSAIVKGVLAITWLGVLFMVLIEVSQYAGQHATKAGLMLIEMSVSLLIMTTVLILLKDLDPSGLKQAMGIMTWMVGLMAALVGVTHFADHADKVKGTLIALTVAIGVMAAAIIIMSFLDAKKVATAAAALGGVIAMFALLIYATSFINTGDKIWIRNLVTIGILTAVVIALAIFISKLADLDPDRAKGAATALGTLLLALSSSLYILSKSKSLNKKNLLKMYATMGALVVVIYALTGAIYILRNVDPDKAIGAAVSLGVLLLALSKSLDVVSRSKSMSSNKLAGVLSTLFMLSIVVMMLSAAILVISKVEPLNALASAVSLGILLLALAKSLDIVSKSKSLSKTALTGVLSVLMILSLVVMTLAVSILLIGNLEPLNALASAVSLGVLLLALAKSLDIVSKSESLSKTKLTGVISVLLTLSLVVIALSIAILMLADVNPINALASAVSLGVLLLALSKSLNIVSKSKSLSKAALTGVLSTLLTLSVVVIALAGAIYILRDVNPLNALASAVALGTLLLALSLAFNIVTASRSLNPGSLGSIAATFAILTVVTALLGTIISELAKSNPTSAIGASVALSILLGTLTLALIPLTVIGMFAGNAILGAIALTAMVVPLTVFLNKLAEMPDISDKQASVVLLVNLMTAMTSLLIPLTLIGVLAPAALLGIIALTAMVIPLKTFTSAIQKLPDLTDSLANMVIISSFMDKMTDILMKVTPLAPLALIGVVAIEAMAIAIGSFGILATAIGALMEKFPSLEEFLNKGLTTLELIAEGLGTTLGKFVTAFGNEVMTLLPDLGKSLSDFMNNAEDFIAGIKMVDDSVTTGVKNLAGSILLLTGAELIAGILSFGGLNIASFGWSLKSFGESILPFVETMKEIDSDTVTAAKSLAELVLALSEAGFLNGITNIMSKFLGTDDMSTFGNKLNSFATAMAGFSSTLKEKGSDIDPAAIESASKAGLAMVELSKAIPKKDGFLQDVVGESDLETFGTRCEAFGKAIKAMSDALTGKNGTVLINDAAIDAAVKAGTSMSKLANAIPKKDGFLQDVVGESDLQIFGNRCKAFGNAIKMMSDALAGDDGTVLINDAAIESAIKAGRGMSDVANAMPKQDGIWQTLAGEQDIATFGNKCKTFGGAIKAMSEALSGTEGESLINIEAIDAAVAAGQGMTKVAESIPKDTIWDGKVSIDDFGKKIKKFAECMSDYSAEIAESDLSGIATSITEANRLVTLTKRVVDLDTSGITSFSDVTKIADTISSYATKVADMDTSIVSSSISAANRLRNFIASLVDLDSSGVGNFKLGAIGNTMKSYINSVKDMDTSVVAGSISCATRLKNFIASLVDLDSSGVGNFKIGSIGSSMRTYAASVAEIDTGAVSSSISAANRLKNFISSLTGLDVSGVSSFKTAINTLGQVNVESFLKAFTGSSVKLSSAGSNMMNSLIKGIQSKRPALVNASKNIIDTLANSAKGRTTTFRTIGIQLMTRFIQGIISQKAKAKSSMSSFLTTVVSSIRGYYVNFYSAGSYLVDGFAAGISANTFKAEAKAKAMAKAALKAAEEALGIASPSKEFYKTGDYAGQGFVNALSDYERVSYKAGASMADSAKRGLSNAISKINSMLDGSMDSQPTIRPVLDLSDITSGASTIDSLFNNPSVGVMANVGAISSMMNRNQNGTNADIISAINKLRGDLGNVRGDTYQINGVTYDDGSNITNAVKELVRAAKVERRI